MAYARWNPPESEVYVIGARYPDDVDMHWECIGCQILPAIRSESILYRDGDFSKSGRFHWSDQIFYARTPGQMFTHLKLHRLLEQAVPDDVFLRLAGDERERRLKSEQEFSKLTAEARARSEERTANQRVAEGDI